MTREEAGRLAAALIRAGRAGEPMPAIPREVAQEAAEHGYFLGQMYAQIERQQEQRQ